MADEDAPVPPGPNPALEFITSNELVIELTNRYPRLIVVREKEVDGNTERFKALFDYQGGVTVALGLCKRLERRMLAVAEEAVEEQDREDGGE